MLTRRLDIILAALISCTCGAVFLRTYNKLIEDHRRQSAWHVPFGRSEYVVTNGAQCFGYLDLTLTDDSSPSIAGTAVLPSQAFGRRMENQLIFSLNFNPLGQLFDGYLQVRAAGNSILIRIERVNPITLSLLGRSGKDPFNLQFAIPGPLEIDKVASDEYIVSHPAMQASHQHPLPPSLISLGTSGMFDNLRIAKREEAAYCDIAKLQPLQIDSLAKSLSQVVPFFGAGLPGAGTEARR